jgi:hypothetical protein
MTRDEAIEIARKHARESIADFSYLADVDEPNWMPHEWVIDAILEAANACSRP